MLAIKKAFNLLGDGIVELSRDNESLKIKIGSYDEKWHQESKTNRWWEKSNFDHVYNEKTDGKTLNERPTFVIINYGKAKLITSFRKEIRCKVKILISWNFKCMILKKIEEKTTDFEPSNNEDVRNKTYLDEKLLKINNNLSSLEKDYNGFKLQYNKQSVEETLIQRAVKTTCQTH